ncbi:hypothetical protein [Haloferax sp. Atlit-12N]|uniref:hypothetical protein n=1 Tax=Haloferax sp. Atlit-12N TaxID=2077203 RepID=UPI0018F71002|nr:hypothetical protein [Haloferax sp. Atlit-12N]
MKRLVSAVFALLLLTSSVGAVASTAGATQVAIDADASVSDPAPGEPFEVTVNLSNVGDEAGEVTDVYLRDPSGTEYARAEDLGSLISGREMSVPMSVTLDEAGRKRLTVQAAIRGQSGEYTRVSYPIYVDVETPDEAAISFESLDPVAGDERSVGVTVANGDTDAISNVKLTLGGDASVDDPKRVSASLAPGSHADYAYNVTFPEAGEHTLRATVQYKTTTGATRTAIAEKTVTAESADIDTGLTATVAESNGSSVIRTTLTEYGNVGLTDVQFRAVVDGTVVERALVSDVDPKSSQTFALSGTDIPTGAVTIVAAYTAGGDAHTTETTIDYNPRELSNIELTGIEATRSGSTVTLSGDAANVGSTDADSVLMSVGDADGVSPAAPNGEYFVGTVESSEFATFELTADTGSNGSVDSLPVEIRYSAGGEQFVRTVDVDLESSESAAQGDAAASSSSGGGSSGLSVAALGLALAVAVGGAGLYWRRQQS